MKRHGQSWRTAITTVLFLFGCGNAAGNDTIVIHDVTVIDGRGKYVILARPIWAADMKPA